MDSPDSSLSESEEGDSETPPVKRLRCKDGHRRPNGRWEARHRPKSAVMLDHSCSELANAYRGFDPRTRLHKYEWLQYFDSRAEKDAFIKAKRAIFKTAKALALKTCGGDDGGADHASRDDNASNKLLGGKSHRKRAAAVHPTCPSAPPSYPAIAFLRRPSSQPPPATNPYAAALAKYPGDCLPHFAAARGGPQTDGAWERADDASRSNETCTDDKMADDDHTAQRRLSSKPVLRRASTISGTGPFAHPNFVGPGSTTTNNGGAAWFGVPSPNTASRVFLGGAVKRRCSADERPRGAHERAEDDFSDSAESIGSDAAGERCLSPHDERPPLGEYSAAATAISRPIVGYPHHRAPPVLRPDLRQVEATAAAMAQDPAMRRRGMDCERARQDWLRCWQAASGRHPAVPFDWRMLPPNHPYSPHHMSYYPKRYHSPPPRTMHSQESSFRDAATSSPAMSRFSALAVDTSPAMPPSPSVAEITPDSAANVRAGLVDEKKVLGSHQVDAAAEESSDDSESLIAEPEPTHESGMVARILARMRQVKTSSL